MTLERCATCNGTGDQTIMFGDRVNCYDCNGTGYQQARPKQRVAPTTEVQRVK